MYIFSHYLYLSLAFPFIILSRQQYVQDTEVHREIMYFYIVTEYKKYLHTMYPITNIQSLTDPPKVLIFYKSTFKWTKTNFLYSKRFPVNPCEVIGFSFVQVCIYLNLSFRQTNFLIREMCQVLIFITVFKSI